MNTELKDVAGIYVQKGDFIIKGNSPGLRPRLYFVLDVLTDKGKLRVQRLSFGKGVYSKSTLLAKNFYIVEDPHGGGGAWEEAVQRACAE